MKLRLCIIQDLLIQYLMIQDLMIEDLMILPWWKCKIQANEETFQKQQKKFWKAQKNNFWLSVGTKNFALHQIEIEKPRP